MVVTLAIDPGGVHVGWANQFRMADGTVMGKAGEWEAPWEAVDMIRAWYAQVKRFEDIQAEIVVEEFRLYARQAQNQIHNPMETSQLIGMIKLIARDAGIPVIEQGASIKVPTRAQLKARGIGLIASSSHAQDAQLHLWYRILNRKDGNE